MKMKHLFLVITFLSSYSLAFSQVYKLETVFENKMNETYLSYWDQLENVDDNAPQYFSLWGYQTYDESTPSTPYEVEYFKGNPKEMHTFLEGIKNFAEKYSDQDKIVTFISNVKVKTIRYKFFNLNYAAVFDKENKVVCFFTPKQWSAILDNFTLFCQDKNIKLD